MVCFFVIYLILSEKKMNIDTTFMRLGSQNYVRGMEYKIMWDKFS